MPVRIHELRPHQRLVGVGGDMRRNKIDDAVLEIEERFLVQVLLPHGSSECLNLERKPLREEGVGLIADGNPVHNSCGYSVANQIGNHRANLFA